MGPYEPEFLWDSPATKSALLSSVVRQNLGWLAQSFITTDPAYPPSPREGMHRVLADDVTNIKLQFFLNGGWVTALQHLESGAAAPYKVLVPIAPAAVTWTIDHNLGTPVTVQCFDATWHLILPSDIQQVSPAFNRVIVQHALPETGFAVIIG